MIQAARRSSGGRLGALLSETLSISILGAADEGRARILYRFAEWNTCDVASWEILRFLHGAEEAAVVWQFGGVSLVRFDADGRIRFCGIRLQCRSL